MYTAVMTLSTFAYIIGFLEILVGVPLIIAPDKTMSWLRKMLDEDALIRVTGAAFIIIGFFVLKDDYSVGTDVPGLIKLVAWITVIKSVIFCWFPQYGRRMHDRFAVIPALRFIWGFLAVIVGCLFFAAGNMLA